MRERKLYSMDNGTFKSYDLIPDLNSIETLKKEYISNSENRPLFYEITSREHLSWDTKDFVLPISQINAVKGLFFQHKESILMPLYHIPHCKQRMLGSYYKSDLADPQLKLVIDERQSKILYYFLFLSRKYKGKYKLNYFDNILSLSKDLFAYELLLQGDFENAANTLFDDIDLKPYFNLEQTAELSSERLKSFLDQKAYKDFLKEEQITHKLINKISGN